MSYRQVYGQVYDGPLTYGCSFHEKKVSYSKPKPKPKPLIETYSGRMVDPTNMTMDDIHIIDIAHSLSMQCRFNGHCSKFYSVAQHSVLVSYLCDRVDALHGLLHDASEAYLTDIPRPLKETGTMDNYRGFENKLQKSIFYKFGLDESEPSSVKEADQVMLATEARDLMKFKDGWNLKFKPVPFVIDPLNPEDAKKIFMERFRELLGNYDYYEKI